MIASFKVCDLKRSQYSEPAKTGASATVFLSDLYAKVPRKSRINGGEGECGGGGSGGAGHEGGLGDEFRFSLMLLLDRDLDLEWEIDLDRTGDLLTDLLDLVDPGDCEAELSSCWAISGGSCGP